MKKPNKTTTQAIDELEAGHGEHFEITEEIYSMAEDADRQEYVEAVMRSLTSADFERLLLKNSQLRAAIKRYKEDLDLAVHANDHLVSAGFSLGQENEKLKTAFHDAIRRPMGTVPDSGSEFYDPSRYDT